MGLGKTIINILQLTRIEHSIIGVVGAITGALIAYALEGVNESLPTVFLHTIYGAWVPFLIIAGSFALNDVYDLEVDKTNQRFDRPLARGELNPVLTKWASWGCIFLGVVMSLAFRLPLFLLSAAFAVAAVTYNIKLKDSGIPGNLTVAACYAAPWAMGGLYVENYLILNGIYTGLAQTTIQALIILIGVAFIGGFGREVLKGLQDIEGDALRDTLTLARTRGPRFAAYVSAICLTTMLILMGLPILPNAVFAYNTLPGLVYILIAIPSACFIIYVTIKILSKPESRPVAKMARNLSLIGFILIFTAFLMGALMLTNPYL
ncbi:MAG: UbiA family prenyltransferase [Candidatus Hodarchaeota archaeon]